MGLFSAILGAAGTVVAPGAGTAAGSAAGSALDSGLLNSIGKMLTGTTDTDRARLARAQVMLVGGLAGSLECMRLALRLAQTTGSNEAPMYPPILKAFSEKQPQLYAQAVQLGPMDPPPQYLPGGWYDGRAGIAELVRLHVHFTAPYLGHDTRIGKAGNIDPTTAAMVQQLANFPTGSGPSLSTTATGGASGTPGTAGGQGTGAGSGVPPWLLPLGIAAVVVVMIVKGGKL